MKRLAKCNKAAVSLSGECISAKPHSGMIRKGHGRRASDSCGYQAEIGEKC